MKTTSLAALLSVFVLCNMASAQDYSIRVTYNTNLRDASSLQGSIVETVPAGTILQVVGMFNRWLKINRNGNEVWLADWVSFSRVTDGGQTQSQIDNCCFVDRQCHSDADWTSGYWAFQNNQCAAPLQSRLQISSQPANSSTGTIDNCCFLDWQCNTDEDWARGYIAFQIDHCDVPAGLIIEGPENFLARVKEALRFLENRAPEWYAYAVSGLDKIRLVEGPNVSAIRARTRTWRVSPDRFIFISSEEADIWVASMMVHEACHVYRYQSGLKTGGYEGEKACVQVELEAAESFDTVGDLVSWLRHVLANFDNPEYQWWN